ncbi:hypothetical protein D3C77_475560 [compost metagenome]
MGGLRYWARSVDISLDESFDSEGEITGHTVAFLSFDGRKLYVGSKDVPGSSWEEDPWTIHSLEEVHVEWHRRLSANDVLNSLLKDLTQTLDWDFERTAPVVASLGQFVTLEKAEIDADLDKHFAENKVLFQSWVNARKCVATDPELSITLSCSHIETVLKKCLKAIGATGYEDESLATLMGKMSTPALTITPP